MALRCAMSLIKTEGLVKEFSRGERSFNAVDGIDFEINKGDFVHLIGRSGSGKSTFLALLSGILTPTAGKVIANGNDIMKFTDLESSKYRNETIGYVPQMMGTLPNLTVGENVELPFHLLGRTGNPSERAFMLLEMMGIEKLKDQFPRQLSGGEIKRVLLARALMNEPELLIADEPTSDLDAETTFEIMELLKKINKDGTSLLIVTHESDILKYGDRVIQMDKGKISDFDNSKV